MILRFSSSGKKVAPLPDGKDLYIDCRAVWDPSKSHGGGAEMATQLAIRTRTPIKAYVEVVDGAIKTLSQRRENSTKAQHAPMTIHCFCAYGMHRSVAMKHILATEFRLKGWDVEVE